MNNDNDLYFVPTLPGFTRPGTPLCTCELDPFGAGVAVVDPECAGTDMH